MTAVLAVPSGVPNRGCIQTRTRATCWYDEWRALNGRSWCYLIMACTGKRVVRWL